MDEQLEFVKEIASRLESAGIPYMMTGSMAMAIYSVPRMTRDIDLVVECHPQDSDRIAALFESDCYVDRHSVREAIARRSIFNIIHNEWVIKADFIVRKDEEYRRLEFERRREFDVDGTPIHVVAAEDLILSKLKMTDTTQEIEARYRQLVLSQSPARRLAMACKMFATAKALVLAGILKREAGDQSPQGLRGQIFLRLYGRDFDTAERQKILDYLSAT